MKVLLQAVSYSLCFATSAFAAPKAIVLDTVAFTQEDLNKLCQQLEKGCDGKPENIGIYTDKQDFYLIDGGRQIALLEKYPDFKIKTLWNFEGYQHSSQEPEGAPLAPVTFDIHPAFYPLNAKQKAIAMLKQEREAYSGGGRTYETADFIELKENGHYAVALSSIPFFYDELIRACFSAEDYDNNPNCHDQNNSILSIKFHEDSPYYRWELTYIDTAWPSGVSEPMRKINKSKPITLIPYQITEQNKQEILKTQEGK